MPSQPKAMRECEKTNSAISSFDEVIFSNSDALIALSRKEQGERGLDSVRADTVAAMLESMGYSEAPIDER